MTATLKIGDPVTFRTRCLKSGEREEDVHGTVTRVAGSHVHVAVETGHMIVARAALRIVEVRA